MKYVLAIDQSTSGTKAIIFDVEGRLIFRENKSHRRIVNEQGWVEHNPCEIIENVYIVCTECIGKSGINADEICSIGITNQRETVVCWNAETGEPVYNAIVWQCGRAADISNRLSDWADIIKRKTGLRPSPYFSAPKITWILENAPLAAQLQAQGKLCCGTVDSWLLFNITRDHAFKTDYSNASRTELLNLDTMSWDEELAELFGIKINSLPELCSSDAVFGYTDLGGALPSAVPITAVMGDSHAAMFANGCHEPGMAKATFGTGTSVMMNTGGKRAECVADGVVETVAWVAQNRPIYALEGNINYSGAVVDWLVKNMDLLENSHQAGIIAQTAEDTGGVYLVPAFSGLGAPYWNTDARAIICGMTAATNKSHLIRAAEESIAYQIKDIIEQLNECGPASISMLCVDGGATRDNFLMSFVADILGVVLNISLVEEMSAEGVAYMASISAGHSSPERLFQQTRHKRLLPTMPEKKRVELYGGWKKAVSMLTK